jgi:hypothetical protein
MGGLFWTYAYPPATTKISRRHLSAVPQNLLYRNITNPQHRLMICPAYLPQT